VSGRAISELSPDQIQAIIFYAGARMIEGKVVTAGGRVLGVTGMGNNLKEALGRAYAAVSHIHFEGMYYRRDIGKRLVEKLYGNG
jgi:phosphoribosylamine--glycine ligase